MSTIMLKPNHIYILQRDVENPALDRRQRWNVNHIPWRAGDKFETSEPLDGFIPSLSPHHIASSVSPGGMVGSIGAKHPGYAALAACLVEVEPVSVWKARKAAITLRKCMRELSPSQRAKILADLEIV